MSSEATLIRDAIFDRLPALALNFNKIRKAQIPQIQPDDLPMAAVFIAGENLTPDGDDNAGEPRFVSETTIAVSVIRGFDDPRTLSGEIDQDVDRIESGLLQDPTFVKFGPGAMFEGVSRMNRRRLYPQGGKDGETYFAELRLEMTFVTRVDYPPIIPTPFEGVTIKARPKTPSHDANDPSVAPVTVVINQQQ
jgi:hypothetical protein